MANIKKPVSEITTREVEDSILVKSVMLPAVFVQSPGLMGLIEATIQLTAKHALSELGNVDLTVRDLRGSDLGLTPHTWNEQTSATTGAFENSAIASASVADNVFIGIYGVANQGEDAVATLEWNVGGRVVAQWDLQKMMNPNPAVQNDLARYGVALSPLVITQNKPVTMRHYVKIGLGAVELVMMGIVVERPGQTISP